MMQLPIVTKQTTRRFEANIQRVRSAVATCTANINIDHRRAADVCVERWEIRVTVAEKTSRAFLLLRERMQMAG